jgi:very-short-patch-repair endonuclease
MPFDITSQIEQWRKQLLDTSKRNRLINFKTGRTGGIALLHPTTREIWDRFVVKSGSMIFAWKRELLGLQPSGREHLGADRNQEAADEATTNREELRRCLESKRLRKDHLLTEWPDARLAARLNRLALNARESQSEQGVSILFIAFGFLRWFESKDSKEEVRSPLLLTPVRLERDSIEAPWRLSQEEDEVLPNFTLAQLMKADFRLQLPDESEVPSDPDDDAALTRYLEAVKRRLGDYPRWEVLEEAALGVFSFQKLAMWEDLGRNQQRISRHDLCRAIAGDSSVTLRTPENLPGPDELDDETDPRMTRHVLEADSSQHAAIVAATRGANLVLDGPPGTGKSQTIANIIAESLAVGRSVLFVSEKTAALDVVKRRLDNRGLGDFCLELHSHKANKRAVLDELDRCLNLATASAPDVSQELRQLLESRRELNAYVRELHQRREPLGQTVFQVHGQLASVGNLAAASRIFIPRILERDLGYLDSILQLLKRLPDCRSVLQNSKHPWRGCRVTTYTLAVRDDVEHHLGRLKATLPGIVKAAQALHQLGLGPDSPTVAEWLSALRSARVVGSCPLVPAEWLVPDPQVVASTVIGLAGIAADFRRAHSQAPELAVEAVWRCGADEIDRLKAALPPFVQPLSAASPRESVGSRLQALNRHLDRLRRVLGAVEPLEPALQRIRGLVQVSLRSPEIRKVARFLDVMERIASQGQVRPSWWDPIKRQELIVVCRRACDGRQRAKEIQANLLERLSPEALENKNVALALDAGRYSSPWRWLWPGWWSLRKRVAAWYVQGLPSSGVLSEDLRLLAEYHQLVRFLTQAKRKYIGDYLTNESKRPDWQASLSAIQAFEQLVAPLNLPPALQDAIVAEGRVDRGQLLNVIGEVRTLLSAFTEVWEELAANHLPGQAYADPSLLGKPPSELARWLREAIEWTQQEKDVWGRVASLLQPASDLPLQQVMERLDAAANMARNYRAAEQQRAGPFAAHSAEDLLFRDWDSDRAQAIRFKGLLGHWPRGLPPPVEAALTQPDVRRALLAAIEQNDKELNGGFQDSWAYVTQNLFDPAADVSTGIVLDRCSLQTLQNWVTEQGKDPGRLREWVRYVEIGRGCARLEVAGILGEVQRAEVRIDDAPEAFRVRFLRLWLDAVYQQVPALQQFSSESHEQLVERFRDLDRRAIASAPLRIRHDLLGRPGRPARVGFAPETSELGVLLREVTKKRRHSPLRKLFAAIPMILTRLKPCLMMSPLSVSTYLQSESYQFDLVIFDEASQVRPHDAVCSIYRGRQLIVAGDQKQLPPTSFFERTVAGEEVDEEEEAGAVTLSDYESILDVCCTLALLRRRLRWHYRSRREPLIAFANHHIYGDELVTFPSVFDLQGNAAVRLEYVADGCWLTGRSGGYNKVEAKKTAELILKHFHHHPDLSLGVIAFNQRQQECILDELEELRKGHPDLDGCFAEDRHEPFFVKNLENVQGDERDVVYLSVGYGPDANRKVAMRFGPLNRPGGERRLNVAVTRARGSMLVVSSLRASDLDLSRTGAEGVKLLKDYLDYAENGSEVLRRTITEAGQRGYDSPFEREVAEELRRQGLTIHPQVGCGGFRIDLGIVDEALPGQYSLGVECDGATYHSSATARDRDRLRQEVLESLGWRICRVWSTDWLRDQAGQVQRVLHALADSRLTPDNPDPPPQPVPQPPGPTPSVTNGAPDPANKAAIRVDPPSFASISDVPENEIRRIILTVLEQCGATEEADLIPHVAGQFGFARTGARIRERIERTIRHLIQEQRILRSAEDNRLRATAGGFPAGSARPPRFP